MTKSEIPLTYWATPWLAFVSFSCYMEICTLNNLLLRTARAVSWHLWAVILLGMGFSKAASWKLSKVTRVVLTGIVLCPLRRKILAFTSFKKTIQHFALLPKLIREMPLFHFLFHQLQLIMCLFFFTLNYDYFIKKVKQIYNKLWLLKHKVEHKN